MTTATETIETASSPVILTIGSTETLTPHTPSESCLCDACPWAKREQAKQAEREATARRHHASALLGKVNDFVTPPVARPTGRRYA